MAKKPQLSKEMELLLKREASMAAMSLGLGLTHIRRYDFVQTGYFYSGLYSVTTGLERIMKLIVIYNHRMLNNDAFPNNAQLKNHSHHISSLFDHAVEVDKRCGFNNGAEPFSKDALYRSIISFLSEFATQARYYNLDLITGRPQHGDEPLKRWADQINAEIERRHYRESAARNETIRQATSAMEKHTFVMMTDESGNDVTSLHQFYTDGDKVTCRQKYSMFYIYNIARFLCNTLASLETKCGFYPFLREFFAVFQNDNNSYVLNKKTWNPNSPYRF